MRFHENVVKFPIVLVGNVILFLIVVLANSGSATTAVNK